MIRRLLLLASTALLLGFAFATWPATGFAHALAQSSTPADGATLQSPPSSVTITFGEVPDPGLSAITVVDTQGRSWTAGPAEQVAGDSLKLLVPLKHLSTGVYAVAWKTVSSVDGHLASGAFSFGVGESPEAGQARQPAVSSAAPPGALAVVARFLLYAGLVIVVGCAVLGFAVRSAPSALLRRVVAADSVLAFLGANGVMAAQITGSGASLASVLGSSLGHALLAREIAVLVLLAAGVALVVRQQRWRVFSLVAGAAAAASMVVDVLFSHAAAQSPAALNQLAQTLHIVAVGVWVGGLVALLAILVGAPAEQRAQAARRLSALAGAGLLVVAATGVFRAVIEVQTWTNLVSTAFGVLVLLKIGLLLVLAGLGALNRFGNLPHLPDLLHRLRRVVSTEVVVAVGALAVAAALVNVAPPSSSAEAAPIASQPVVVTGSDFGTSVKVRLSVSPGRVGMNDFALDVDDYDSGQPVDAQGVAMTFALPNQSVIGASSLAFTRARAGVYQARGGNLAVDGTWQVVALIERGASSVEVPMRLTTHSVPPNVTRTPFAGAPTLYTIHLAQGGAVQVYIDPDKAGQVEFHMTFLDAQMKEVLIASAAATETEPDGSAQDLPVRRLDDIGHFVADAAVTKAVARFAIIATTASGSLVSTYIELSPAS